MTRITKELIKRKAEHNDGIIADLEEVSLHQLEIERIENNIIPKIENLTLLKDLEYLNLALNNIEKIEGLETCEFLKKLDLTVNFVDLDWFRESVENLRENRNLREIYLLGNPCTEWEGWREYVVHCLPQLQSVDGKEITVSERIIARQNFRKWEAELEGKAAEAARKKALKQAQGVDSCAHDPSVRYAMYKELSDKREEEEKKKKEEGPRERNYDSEHREAVERERKKEKQGLIRQTNQGEYSFAWTDDDGKGNLILEVDTPKFLSTTLIDVDVQPKYVSVIIKGKTLRLENLEEVHPDRSSCERSQTTGRLKIVMPKATPESDRKKTRGGGKASAASEEARSIALQKPVKRGEEILSAVDFRNIVRQGGDAGGPQAPLLVEQRLEPEDPEGGSAEEDDPSVPPLI